MNTNRALRHLTRNAEQVSWQLAMTDLTGVGTDESGIVWVQVDGGGQVQQVDIGPDWWSKVGPAALTSALLSAVNKAIQDRLTNWSTRVAEREGAEPPEEWRSGGKPAQGIDTAGKDAHRYGEITRILDLIRGARVELDGFRHRLDEQRRQQITGNGADNRITVGVTGGQLTEVEISRRWLNEQPTGQAIADEFRAACQDAYQRSAVRSAATSAATPSLTAVRDLTHDPVGFLRRLGVNASS